MPQKGPGVSPVLNLTFWRSHAASYGAWPTLKCLGHRATNHLIPHATLVCVLAELENVDKAFLNIPRGFEARFLSPRELQSLSQIKDYDILEAFLRDASEKGDECYAILDGNRAAAFGWYSRLPTAINKDLKVRFDPEYVYMYFGYTHPDYRGKRLHAIGMTRALYEYTQRGCKGMISFVHSDNFPSLRSCERMGYKEIGRIYSAKIGGRHWIRASKECRALQLELVPNVVAPPPN